MEAIALIPARGGSKRIPMKNIKLLGDLPLIVYSILAASGAGLDVWVSTDHPEISEVACKFGATVIQRPWALCQDHVTDYPVIRHALTVVDYADLVVYLRPTTPFRTAEKIEEALQKMLVTGYDSLRSVHEMSETAYKCFRMKGEFLYPLTKTDLTDKPNQALPATYHPNGYVDIARREIVDPGGQNGSIWGKSRYGFITPRAVELDTPEDWEYAEYIWTKRQHRR
jgi:N-acylneuraminate cytidylyltransferase